MRARGATSAGAQGSISPLEERNKWETVTWMPHASLSQTSHISLGIRSVLTSLDELQHFKPKEWRVRVTVHGMAGQPIVPMSCLTPTAPVTKIHHHSKGKLPVDLTVEEWSPLTSDATHVCRMDSLLHVPLRWRDLPRDSYLRFEVLGHCDEVVRIVLVHSPIDGSHHFFILTTNFPLYTFHSFTKPQRLSSMAVESFSRGFNV